MNILLYLFKLQEANGIDLCSIGISLHIYVNMLMKIKLGPNM